MNDAMPGWRTFTSDGPAAGDPDPDGPRGEKRRANLSARMLGLVLAVLGACAASAAVVLVVLLILPSSGADPGGAIGDPLGDDPAAAAWAGETLEGSVTAVAEGGDPAAGIVVDVAGAVMRPGLVRLRRGDRVGDAIAAAGGFAPRVDLTETGRSLNLAQALEDGAKVVVPMLGAEGPRAGAAADGGDDRIDLNHADQAALESLPGIGPVTAARIVEARRQQPFASVDELRTREVVGESVFEDIRDLVRASG